MSDVIERTEVLHPWPAMALGGLLGVAVPEVENGEELPLLWHWLHLLEWPDTADLGEDGHPVRGVLPAPPGPGRRRMFAGGRVRRLGPLRCGEPATRRTSIEATVDKVGRSGQMTFVTVRHEISQNGQLVIDEHQDIVYRNALTAAATRQPVDWTDTDSEIEPSDGAWQVDTPPTLLFRFSALTYNAHRIHYDRPYAQNIEGYPGLVVHGPLQALLMTEAARRLGPQPARAEFSFRLLAPVFSYEGLIVEADPGGRRESALMTSVRSGCGHQTATGLLTRAG